MIRRVFLKNTGWEQTCIRISIEHSILACKEKVWEGRGWKRFMKADPSNLCWPGLWDCCGFGRLILGSTRRPGAPVRIRSIISCGMLPAVRDVGGHGLDPIQSVGDGGGGVRVRGRHHSPPQHRAQMKGDSKTTFPRRPILQEMENRKRSLMSLHGSRP